MQLELLSPLQPSRRLPSSPAPSRQRARAQDRIRHTRTPSIPPRVQIRFGAARLANVSGRTVQARPSLAVSVAVPATASRARLSAPRGTRAAITCGELIAATPSMLRRDSVTEQRYARTWLRPGFRPPRPRHSAPSCGIRSRGPLGLRGSSVASGRSTVPPSPVCINRIRFCNRLDDHRAFWN